MDPDYIRKNTNNPEVRDYLERRSQYDKTIQSLNTKMQDPALKGLDDAYKQFYISDRTGLPTQIWDAITNAAQDAFTYNSGMAALRE
jgi:hypothetical protein